MPSLIKLMLPGIMLMGMAGCTVASEDGSEASVPSPAATPADGTGSVEDGNADGATASVSGRGGTPTSLTAPAPGGGSRDTSTPVNAATSNDCATLAVIPAGVTTGSNLRSDVDADGRPDTVGTYRTAEGDQWRLRVAFAAGGGSEVVLPVEPGPGVVAVLGSAPLGPAVHTRPVLFVATSSGASSRTVELFGIDGCELVALTNAEGASPTFVVGASVGHQEGLRCERIGEQQVVVEVLSVPAATGGFSVTARPFTRDGTQLLTVGDAATTVSPMPPPEAGRIAGCGDVIL